MNRKLFLTVFLFLSVFAGLVAQTAPPQGFNYQAVARDAAGLEMSNHTFAGVKVDILDAGSNVVYSETFSAVTTNPFGLLNLVVGLGTATTTGIFSNIAWGASVYSIRVWVDDGSGFVQLGLTKLWSVPYALYATNSPIGPAGPTGANGAPGAPGTAGPTGAIGATGLSLNWKGSFAVAPATPAQNDAYYNTTAHTSYVFSGAIWQVLVKDGAGGTTGATGTPGLAGTNGTNGNTGATGAPGINGTNGVTGATGAMGVTGATGIAGTNGAWTRTGNYLYPTALGDSVGIGTNLPGVRLDVANGSIRMTDGFQAQDKVMVSDPSGKATWQYTGGPIKGSAPVSSSFPIPSNALSYYSVPLITISPSESGMALVQFTVCYNYNQGSPSQLDVGLLVTNTSNVPTTAVPFSADAIVGFAGGISLAGPGTTVVPINYIMPVTAGTNYYIWYGSKNVSFNQTGATMTVPQAIVTFHKTGGL
jgi:hypothetical protein